MFTAPKPDNAATDVTPSTPTRATASWNKPANDMPSSDKRARQQKARAAGYCTERSLVGCFVLPSKEGRRNPAASSSRCLTGRAWCVEAELRDTGRLEQHRRCCSPSAEVLSRRCRGMPPSRSRKQHPWPPAIDQETTRQPSAQPSRAGSKQSARTA